MSHSLSESPVTFHISMNVSDIDRSVEFFSKVFGISPSKHREDYAKFELTNPPITFSLEPVSPAERGALNHVGFKFQSSKELVELQRCLEMAGLRSEREEGVECCYSKQTKFWLHDPDGTLWEMYVLEGDLEHRGAGQNAEAVMGSDYGKASLQVVSLPCSMDNGTPKTHNWSHRLGNPLVIPDEIPPESLDEIALQGSFNGEATLPQIGPFVKEVADRLKPGGRLAIHCLTSDRHVEDVPQLPGPASVVKSVPCLDSLVNHLEEAGFEAIRLTKYGSRACFTAGEAELRETMLEALKPKSAAEERLTLLYRGPFPALKLDDGTTMHRGKRTELPRQVVEQLMSSAVRDSFTVIETATSPVSCSG